MMYGRTTFFLYGTKAVQNGYFCTIRPKTEILLISTVFPISFHEAEPSAIFEVKLTSKSTVFHQKLNFHRSVQDFFSTAKKPYIENCVRNMFFSKVIENEPFHNQIKNTHRPTTSKFLNQL